VSISAIHVVVRPRHRLFVVAKRVVQALFVIVALPRCACFWLGNALLGPRAFMAASESIARIPGIRGVLIRQAFYGRVLAHCGKDVYFGWLSVFSMTEARIGDRAYIGKYCSLGFADLEDEVMLADGAQILSGGHEHNRHDTKVSMQSQAQTYHRVRIGRGSWIGAGAIVMADVGEHSIVGAGAVVTKPLPAFSVAIGVPARIVRTLQRPRISADPQVAEVT